MATSAAQLFVRENRFYGRIGLTISAVIFIGFALFDTIAAVPVLQLPWIIHLHAAVMAAWLALFVTQSLLGAGRNLPLHRKLGWLGAVLAALVVLIGWSVGYHAVTADRVPPVFDKAYFMALTLVQPVLFAALVYAAIAQRKRTDWHRRLMLGALIVIMEPLLGRLTLIGAMVAMGGPEPALAYFTPRQWLAPGIEMVLQLAVVAFVMARDRAIRGSVHPALWRVAVAVVGLYAANWTLAAFPPFAGWVASLAA